jgi:ABC-type transport system involved in cytochrome bd biosynthesis fused ATPase/permease subunit
LDEATSALDYDTEHQVSVNLMEWAEGRTVFPLPIGLIPLSMPIKSW